jgi:hypothetical protein
MDAGDGDMGPTLVHAMVIRPNAPSRSRKARENESGEESFAAKRSEYRRS